ncbi:G-type lectin S-receptor-like serine/threonine-protein kinase At1g11330 [Salvia splendens]|uniref:G-type lectin S-receptor-like serine/threonine-protein kinase At1g11330 n=1 Tax=Salvia splendens TaxID=180675 RepID=UPI001C25E41E|nr:G-type lectin S-receptor-like serine/threonine-protein kinase At1g11330 [Salvia splendens]
MAYWRSGRLVDFHDDDLGNVKNFENYYMRPDHDNFNYNLTSGGDYFMYTVIQGGTLESRKATSGWLLDETGNVSTIDKGVSCGSCPRIPAGDGVIVNARAMRIIWGKTMGAAIGLGEIWSGCKIILVPMTRYMFFNSTKSRLILIIYNPIYKYWRSGRLVDYHDDDLGNVKNFENFYISPDPDNFNYNLTSQGDYFMYTVIQVEGRTVDSRKVTSGWLLDEAGNITTIDDRGITLVMASVCYGYNSGDDLYDKGCELWEQPKCLKRRQLVDLRSGYFTHANTTPVERTSDSNASLSLSDCRDACWKWSDCECAGYANYIGRDSGCSYWIGRDLEWVQNSAGSDEKIYVLQSPPKAKAKSYIGIILGVVSAVVLLMLAVVVLIMRNRKVKREEELHELLTMEGYTGSYELDNNGHQLKLFTYSSVISATDNFSSNNKLGEGGFGPVYKGRTGEGQDIAVKLLSRKSGQGLLEFKNELILISELQHVNLVKLVGFCIHKDDKMIIYDYMPNKSLDCFLFGPSGREQLDWEKRFNIIEGTAQGLLYLHKHSRLKIIHRDMKPNNILLDQNMTPKISDFGLARIFKEAASEVNTNRRVGTYGYMAPEYAMQGIFSVKSDVYSYGVLVLEIVSGRRNGSFHEIEGPLSIVEYAWELWRKDSALELMDPMLREESCVLEQLQKCIHIGLLCVENHAVDRPTIEDVLSMLKNETATLPMPKNPSFITRNSVFQQTDKATPQQSSENQVTLSQMQGR